MFFFVNVGIHIPAPWSPMEHMGSGTVTQLLEKTPVFIGKIVASLAILNSKVFVEPSRFTTVNQLSASEMRQSVQFKEQSSMAHGNFRIPKWRYSTT